jgi:hypothetical protein
MNYNSIKGMALFDDLITADHLELSICLYLHSVKNITKTILI